MPWLTHFSCPALFRSVQGQVGPPFLPRYAGAVARLALHADGKPIGMLLPEKRMYFQQEQPTTIPAATAET